MPRFGEPEIGFKKGRVMTTRYLRVSSVICTLLALCPVAMAQEDTGSQDTGASAAQGKQAASQPSNWLATSMAMSQPSDKPSSQPSAFDEKLWDVKFKVYGWVPSVSGHAGVGRKVSTVDVTKADVIEGLDLIESMVPVDLEVRYDHWGIFADLLYVRLENSVQKGPVKVDVEADQTIFELGGFYRVGTWPLSPGSDKTLTLDALGGARYNRVSGSIGLQHPQRAISVGGAQEWWDPFVGPRINWHALDKLDIFARGDVGGFGIENCSHITWQFIGGADYYFTKNFFVELGYRLLDTDFEKGSGRDYFKYDLLTAGPYLAIGVKF